MKIHFQKDIALIVASSVLPTPDVKKYKDPIGLLGFLKPALAL